MKKIAFLIMLLITFSCVNSNKSVVDKSVVNEEVKQSKPKLIKMKVTEIKLSSGKYQEFIIKDSDKYSFETKTLTFNVGDSIYVDNINKEFYNIKTPNQKVSISIF